MNNELINAFKTLKAFRYKLTKQQYKTFKGQILSGNIEGFKKGLNKIVCKN